MNIITHKAAYSLFPKATFEECLTLFTSNRTPQREQAIKKYADRGWTVVRTITNEDQENELATFRYGKRWIADKQSWVISLDTNGVGRDDDPLASASFNIFPTMKAFHRNQPEIRFVTVVDPALSKPLITNYEFGVKARVCMNHITRMYEDPYGGWDPSFYSEEPPNIEENIAKWNEACKNLCTCSYIKSKCRLSSEKGTSVYCSPLLPPRA